MTKLGNYELIERLAVGGMAELFRARRVGGHGFKKTVAIKKILPQLANNDTFVNMFVDEARITALLDHPNIVQVFEFESEDDELYLVMQLVDGSDLFTLMGKTRKLDVAMPPELAAFIAHEILAALDYAHNAEDENGEPLGIIHRDVSPGNVLISKRGNVMLTDFGIAWAYERHQKTEAGKLKGKFGYMSPEQVAGEPIDARSDVFATGILLSEMLINRHLFVGQSDLDILLMVRDADIERLTAHSGSLPEDLVAIAVKALAPRPAARYQSAREFRNALADWLFAHKQRMSAEDLADYASWVQHKISARALELAHGVSEPEPEPTAKGSDVSAKRDFGKDEGTALEGPHARRKIARGSAPRKPTVPARVGAQPNSGAQPAPSAPPAARHSGPIRPSGRMSQPHGMRASSRDMGPTDQGHFETRWPMTVLYQLAHRGATGLLMVERGEIIKEAYFQDGHPRQVNSNLPNEGLGPYLTGIGAVQREELEEALIMLPHFDNQLVEALISLGFLEPLDALRHLSDNTLLKLVDVCNWNSGSFRWYEGRMPPSRARELQLDTFLIIGEAAKALTVPQVVEWAKGIRSHAVQQDFAGADLQRFGLGDAIMRAQVLLENHQTTVTDLAGRVHNPTVRLEFIRALYLLIQCGLARLVDPMS